MGRIAKAIRKIRFGRAVRYLNRERKAANYDARAARNLAKESKERTIQARGSLRSGLMLDAAGERLLARGEYNMANLKFDQANRTATLSRIAVANASSIRSQARENAREIAGRNGGVRKKTGTSK